MLYTTSAASQVLAPVGGALGGDSFELTTRSAMPVTYDDEGLAAVRSKRRCIEVRRQLRRLAEHGCVVGSGGPYEPFVEFVGAR
ncbi:hypothetical protein [Streptomyces griseofuscus]|uniref:hypothetical protein n=1 Tax=Streptomyces griseofuscus TaxID=146922 RepID=UPI0036CBB831